MPTFRLYTYDLWGNDWPRCSKCGSTVVERTEEEQEQHGLPRFYHGGHDTDGVRTSTAERYRLTDTDDDLSTWLDTDHEADNEGETDGVSVNDVFRQGTYEIEDEIANDESKLLAFLSSEDGPLNGDMTFEIGQGSDDEIIYIERNGNPVCELRLEEEK